MECNSATTAARGLSQSWDQLSCWWETLARHVFGVHLALGQIEGQTEDPQALASAQRLREKLSRIEAHAAAIWREFDEQD